MKLKLLAGLLFAFLSCAAQQAQARAIRDVGFVPEGERLVRSTGNSPYDFGQASKHYPFDRIFEAAELASMLEPRALPALKKAMTDPDSTVRYWGTLGILMRCRPAVRLSVTELRSTLKDSSPYVRILTAQILAEFGDESELPAMLRLLVEHADWKNNDVFVVMTAFSSLDALGPKAASVASAIKALPAKGPTPDARFNEYPVRWLETFKMRFP